MGTSNEGMGMRSFSHSNKINEHVRQLCRMKNQDN